MENILLIYFFRLLFYFIYLQLDKNMHVIFVCNFQE
jgi:hypothetical protein